MAEIERRQAAYATASGNFWNQQSIAYSRYLNDPFAQATKQAFSAWVTQNDALFISYQNAMKNAAGKSVIAARHEESTLILLNVQQISKLIRGHSMDHSPTF